MAREPARERTIAEMINSNFMNHVIYTQARMKLSPASWNYFFFGEGEGFGDGEGLAVAFFNA